MRLAVAPFVKRSLQTEARSFRTYLIRGGMVGYLLFTLLSVHQGSRWFGAPGLRFFSQIAYVNAVLIALAGPLYFASIITDEKENLTLGLLKMTGLRPLSLLLGESTSQLFGAAMLLLVQVPLTVLAVALGGVSTTQVIAAYVALLAHLVFVANVALLCSTVCRRTSRAAVATGVLLLAFYLLPPLSDGLAGLLVRERIALAGTPVVESLKTSADLVRGASVFNRLGDVLQTGFSGGLLSYQFWVDLALGAGFFLLAWVGFERLTRHQVSVAPGRGLAFRSTSRLRRLGVDRCWANALAWKDFYFAAGGKGMVIVEFVLWGLVLVGAIVVQNVFEGSVDWDDTGVFLMGVMLVVLFIQFLLLHNRVLGNEWKEHTLPALMMLPMSTMGILYLKMLGALLGVLPAVFWLVIGVWLAPIGSQEFQDAAGEPALWFFLCQVVVLMQLALYLSLVLRRGALLLSFVAWIFLVQMGSWAAMAMFGAFTGYIGGWDYMDVGFAAAAILLLVLAAFLHRAALRRAEMLAGRG
ncbi:MAG: hypothetical protein R6V05_01495 [Candidatus Brocadiia bacterium]